MELIPFCFLNGGEKVWWTSTFSHYDASCFILKSSNNKTTQNKQQKTCHTTKPVLMNDIIFSSSEEPVPLYSTENNVCSVKCLIALNSLMHWLTDVPNTLKLQKSCLVQFPFKWHQIDRGQKKWIRVFWLLSGHISFQYQFVMGKESDLQDWKQKQPMQFM